MKTVLFLVNHDVVIYNFRRELVERLLEERYEVIISSRYGKMVKRIQNTILQALTDAINLLLLDRNLIKYVNEFTLHMLPPTTQEELDRRENLSSKVQLTSDIMNMLTDIENNIYIPTHEGIGAITTSQIGGDVDVKSLADLDYYQDKWFGSLRVPK